jgi:phosphatidylserine/phosphatidylglycerophosphate/cardiolipin synthase-like enzyme
MLKKYGIPIISLFMAFSVGVFTGCSHSQKISHAARHVITAVLPAAISHPNTVPATGTIEVAFSPYGGAAQTVVNAIGEARQSIKVQAYSFTNKEIAGALVKAYKSGIDVRVILDKSNQTERYSAATFLVHAGIPVKIDHDFAIAHSKVMIIDGVNVITGSFNFTKAADTRNSENVLVIRGNRPLADLYLKDWQWRWDACPDYVQ